MTSLDRRAGTLAAVVISALLALGCAGPGASGVATPTSPAATSPGASPSTSPGAAVALADVPRSATVPGDAERAAAAVNDLGLDLLRRMDPQANAVLSPASVVLALAMARPGARGETAAQMDAVLRDVASDEHAAWLNALDAALASRTGTFTDPAGKKVDVTLRIANAAYGQRDLAFEPAYLEALASRFGAGVRLVDYRADPEAARRQINGWVDEQTQQRIPELLASGALDRLTRLVLVNAIYLKAPWVVPFAEDATAPAAFTRLDGSTVEVPTMTTHGSFLYAAGTGWEAVQLPYVGDSLAMTVIVPDDLVAFESTLDAQVLASIVAALDQHAVDLALPKFGIETRTELGAVLATLGMADAFDPDRADFSGITTAEAIYIAAVIHQANIDVDEKGTEAAAATAVMMGGAALPAQPVAMQVDSPFVFALRDVSTGAVLFLGRVVEPKVRS